MKSIVIIGSAMTLSGTAAFADFGEGMAFPLKQLTYSIDGNVPMSIDLVSVYLPTGQVKYTGSVVTPEQLELSVVFVVDEFSDPIASANGQFKCINNSGVSRIIDAQVHFPLCPAITGGTQFGGTCTLLLTNNAGGGGVSALQDSSGVWQTTISGSSVYGIFLYPFQMSSSGSGTMQSNTIFGAPIPSITGPSTASSLGSRNQFMVTAGDSVTITTNTFVKSLGLGSPCAADVDGNGAIDGADLARVLDRWGASDNCVTEDLNEDGVVDGSDMAIVLGKWGPCD